MFKYYINNTSKNLYNNFFEEMKIDKKFKNIISYQGIDGFNSK